MNDLQNQSSKRKSIIFWLIFGIVVVASVWYYQTTTPSTLEQNITTQTTPIVTEAGVAKGDLVEIDYVLSLANGSVVDTNNASLATEYNIATYTKGPFRFIVGQSGKLKGFDDALLGMKLGEERTQIIPASEPVLKYTLNLTRHVLRTYRLPRFYNVPISRFEKIFNKKPVINDVVINTSLPWSYKVINESAEAALIEPMVEEGKTYHLPGFEWNSTLVVKTHDDLVFIHNPEDGQVIKTELGPAAVTVNEGTLNINYLAKLNDVIKYYASAPGGISLPYQFQVKEVTDTTFTIQRINYLLQETLKLTAKLNSWEPGAKKIKPELKTKETYKKL